MIVQKATTTTIIIKRINEIYFCCQITRINSCGQQEWRAKKISNNNNGNPHVVTLEFV